MIEDAFRFTLALPLLVAQEWLETALDLLLGERDDNRWDYVPTPVFVPGEVE